MSIWQKIFKKKSVKVGYTKLWEMGNAVWTPMDYEALAEAGYRRNATVYACVNLIAKSASRIRWYAIDKSGKEINHKAVKLLNNPNDRQSGARMIEELISYLLLSGNGYLLKRYGVGEVPGALFVLRSDKVKAIKGNDGEIIKWKYGDEEYGVEEVLHIKEFNPVDEVYGLGRVEVAARDIDILNAAKEWNLKLIQNDMRPSGIFNFEQELTEEQRKVLREILSEDYSGVSNAGKFIITEGKGTWTQASVNPKDVDWMMGQKFVMRQICAVFGVPSELLGDSENKTYSNYREARRALYEEVVLPMMDVLRDELNGWLMKDYGDEARLEYDRDEIEALQEERERKYDYLSKAKWLSVNDLRAATGYGEVDGGDVPLVMMESGIGGIGGEKEELKRDEGKVEIKRAGVRKKKSFWMEEGRRNELWQAFEERARRRERTFKAIAMEYLRRQAKRVEEELKKYPSVGQVEASRLLDLKVEGERAVKMFWSWAVDAAMRAGRAGYMATKGAIYEDVESGLLVVEGGEVKAVKRGEQIIAFKDKWEFVLAKEKEEELRRMIYESGTKVAKTTIDKIKPLIIEGVEDNWTIKQLSERIWEKVEEFMPWRSRLWAETESTKIENWAMLDGYSKNPEIEKKGWHCAFIETSREEHMEADGQEVKLSEAFEVGGEELMYPGDPKGSPWNVCNCRCSQYPVVE